MLRDYQHRFANETCPRLIAEGYRRILGVGPTGCGKGHIIKALADRTVARQKRAIILARGIDLVSQTSERLIAAELDHGVVMRGHPRYAPDRLVQVCAVDTLRARGEAPEPGPNGTVIISDEAHGDGAETRQLIVRAYDNPIVIGLTATPERGDGIALGPGGAEYQIIVQITTVEELQKRWYETNGAEGLVPIHTYSTADEKPRSEPAWNIVEKYAALTPGQPAIIFCEGVKHARKRGDDFRALGFRAAHVEGGEASAEVIEAQRRGEIQVICNVFKLTEGVDMPWVTVVGIDRGVSHCGAAHQMWGRGLRTHPGKMHCTILDPYGHVFRGWSIEVPRVWSLDGKPSRPAVKLPPLRQCEWCGCVARPGDRCPRCGEEQPAHVTAAERKEQARFVRADKMKDLYRRQWNSWCEIVGEARKHPQWSKSVPYMRYRAMWQCAPMWKVRDVPV